MALARFRKICIDAVDPLALGRFWAAVLDQHLEPDPKGEAGVVRPDGKVALWFNRVPQPKTVKHRVHLDVYARSLGDLEALGSKVVLAQGGNRRWTVMADPEGGEYCAFIRDDLPAERLHGLVVDCLNPTSQAAWWGHVLKAEVVHHGQGYSTVQNVKKLRHLTLDFVPVPEPKVAANRIHWDVTARSVDALVDSGAKVIRSPDRDIRWSVLADPEGNEFCVFPKN